MLTDNQDTQNQGNGLGDDGEVHPAHTAFKHGVTDDIGKDGRYSQYRNQREWQALERLPKPWQCRQLVPVHKVRNPRGGLNLGTFRIGGLELEEHGHGITAQTKENALAQTQNTAVAPQHHQTDCDKGIGQVFPYQVESEDVHTQRQDNEDNGSQYSQTDHPFFTPQQGAGAHFFP